MHVAGPLTYRHLHTEKEGREGGMKGGRKEGRKGGMKGGRKEGRDGRREE
jgi:hypothetical protein